MTEPGAALLLTSEEHFRAMVADAIDALPERFRAEVGRTVEFLVEREVPPEVVARFWVPADEEEKATLIREHGWSPEAAARAQRRAGPADLYPHTSWEIYGCYLGVTLPERFRAGPCPPSLIYLFLGPCLRANVDEDALRFQVRNLVEHELGHHFGLTEAEIAEAHRRKRGQERKNPGY